MKAGDMMTRRVVTVAPDAPIEKAVRLMLQHCVSGLPVVDGSGKLVGIITEGDLLRRAEIGTEHQRPRWLTILLGRGRLASDYVRSHGRKVKDVMTRDVVAITETTLIREVVELMEIHRIKRLPVLRRRRLVGIVSRANLIRALVGLASKAPTNPGSRHGDPRSCFGRDRRPALVPRYVGRCCGAEQSGRSMGRYHE
jgi:CBS domain-containing protein